MEASYREYHKTAFTAATVHPAEAAQEAQRMRTVVCSLVGLRPPPPPTQEGTSGDGGGDGGGERVGPTEVDGAVGRAAGEEAEGGEAVGGEEVRTYSRSNGQICTRLFEALRNESRGVDDARGIFMLRLSFSPDITILLCNLPE